MKLKLDLHDVYNRGHDIDRALRDVIEEAVRTKATVVEIIPGKGSGQLKKRVLRFLDQKEIKAQYDRVEKDSRNFGRGLRTLPLEVAGDFMAAPSSGCELSQLPASTPSSLFLRAIRFGQRCGLPRPGSGRRLSRSRRTGRSGRFLRTRRASQRSPRRSRPDEPRTSTSRSRGVSGETPWAIVSAARDGSTTRSQSDSTNGIGELFGGGIVHDEPERS